MAGRPLITPEPGEPVSDFFIAYNEKHKRYPSQKWVAQKIGVDHTMVWRYRNRKVKIDGSALVALDALRKEVGI